MSFVNLVENLVNPVLFFSVLSVFSVVYFF